MSRVSDVATPTTLWIQQDRNTAPLFIIQKNNEKINASHQNDHINKTVFFLEKEVFYAIDMQMIDCCTVAKERWCGTPQFQTHPNM